jgi:hypothetical protein
VTIFVALAGYCIKEYLLNFRRDWATFAITNDAIV